MGWFRLYCAPFFAADLAAVSAAVFSTASTPPDGQQIRPFNLAALRPLPRHRPGGGGADRAVSLDSSASLLPARLLDAAWQLRVGGALSNA